MEYVGMLRPVCKRLKQPFQSKHPCRSLPRLWAMFKFWSKNGNTKIMLVCLFGKNGENRSAFGLYFEEKSYVFGLYYRLYSSCVITAVRCSCSFESPVGSTSSIWNGSARSSSAFLLSRPPHRSILRCQVWHVRRWQVIDCQDGLMGSRS